MATGAERGSQNLRPNLSQAIGTLSLMKAFKAKEDENVNNLAQLNMSQHQARGSRGRADVGAAGMRRGIKSFVERKSLSANLNRIPLNLSSRLIA